MGKLSNLEKLKEITKILKEHPKDEREEIVNLLKENLRDEHDLIDKVYTSLKNKEKTVIFVDRPSRTTHDVMKAIAFLILNK